MLHSRKPERLRQIVTLFKETIQSILEAALELAANL
jgi:hypothetical protein